MRDAAVLPAKDHQLGSSVTRVDNLNNLSMVVCCYKKKLRRREAQNFLGEMDDQLNLSLGNLGTGSVSTATSFNSAEDTSELVEVNENIGGGVIVAAPESIINTREVTVEEWVGLETQAQETHVNTKGKPQALCWQCERWFEARTGLRIHIQTCASFMHVCATRGSPERINRPLLGTVLKI
jgi:hypothetical protein